MKKFGGPLLSVLLVTAAHAQETQKPTSDPNVKSRVPEAATDVPIKAPGPQTGSPAAAGPSTGTSSLPTVSTGSGTSDASRVLENPPASSEDTSSSQAVTRTALEITLEHDQHGLFCPSMRRRNESWTTEETMTLREMAAQGKTCLQIALRLRRSQSAVKHRAQRLGLALSTKRRFTG